METKKYEEVKEESKEEISDEEYEIAKYLYEEKIVVEVNDEGKVTNIEDIPTYEEFNNEYKDCSKEDYDKAVSLIKELVKDAKYYDEYLELNDNPTYNDAMPDYIDTDISDYDEIYNMEVTEAIEKLQDEIGTGVYLEGNNGRHVVVEDTFDNIYHYKEYKEAQEKAEEELVNKIADIYKAEENK